MALRYNCNLIKVEDASEETPHNYIHYAEVVELINQMGDGDEMTIQAVEYTGGI